MTGQGENNRGGKERSENARHVSACRDVCMCPRMCGVCYIKRPITINSGDAVYRGGTRNGINPRGLSADTAIMKRIGLLSVPQVRLSKVQSPMTAGENITSCHNRYSRQPFRYETPTALSLFDISKSEGFRDSACLPSCSFKKCFGRTYQIAVFFNSIFIIRIII